MLITVAEGLAPVAAGALPTGNYDNYDLLINSTTQIVVQNSVSACSTTRRFEQDEPPAFI
jgi:hypothetical protein